MFILIGWLRDLTRECVERNPGPTLEGVLADLRKILGKKAADYETELGHLEADILVVPLQCACDMLWVGCCYMYCTCRCTSVDKRTVDLKKI